MTHYDTAYARQQQLPRWAPVAGIAGLVLLVAGILLSPEQFYHSYLYAYLFWLGMALGGAALVMLQHLVGGTWGLVIRRPLEAAAMLLPLMALLFIPILLGMHDLYEWTHHEVVAQDPVLQEKTWYLDETFFIGRAIFYLVVWSLLGFFLNRLSLQQDDEYSPRRARRLRDLSRAGLVLYMLTMTFAAFDWAMSLEPHWYSTIFGAVIVVGQALGTLAFAIIVILLVLARREPMASLVNTKIMTDLGNLLLAFTMFWAYVNFSQFLIIWSGNLPEEATWYVHRLEGGWGVIPVLLIVLHFLLPFMLLIWRLTKRTPGMLIGVAAVILAMHLVDLYWTINPTFYREGITIRLMDLLAPIGIGGLWLAGFAWFLVRRPLVPLNDPRLEEIEHHEQH